MHESIRSDRRFAGRGHAPVWSLFGEAGYSRGAVPVLLLQGRDILEAERLFGEGGGKPSLSENGVLVASERGMEAGDFSFLVRRLLAMGFLPRLLERTGGGELSLCARRAIALGIPLQLEPKDAPLEASLLRVPARVFLSMPVSLPHVRACGPRLLLQEMAKAPSSVACLRPWAPQGEHAWPVAVSKDGLASHGLGSTPVNGAEVSVGDLSGTASFASRFSLEGASQAYLEGRVFCSLYPEEAWRLLLRSNPSERLRAHSLAVAKAAGALAKALSKKGAGVDAPLAAAGGILHDLAKGHSRHELCGAAMLEALGLHRLSYCVREHRDLVLADSRPLTEREIVYLADKWCSGGGFVEIERRFGEKAALFSSSPLALAAVRRRLAHAKALEARMEKDLGFAPAPLVRRAVEGALDPDVFGRLIAGEA